MRGNVLPNMCICYACHVSECDQRVSDFDLMTPPWAGGGGWQSAPLLCRVVAYGERVSEFWRHKKLMNSFGGFISPMVAGSSYIRW